MAKITRIKAGESSKKTETPAKKVAHEKKATEKTIAKPIAADTKKTDKKSSDKKKPFILIRPFVAFFRYLKDSWLEIRQVRWPNRKATWKMVLAVFVYTILFVILITLLHMLFSFLFNLIIK